MKINIDRPNFSL